MAARLAVYGTLAPGRVNHHLLEPLGGTWRPGVVHGELFDHGWGTTYGYPAIRLGPGGPAVEVWVLESDALGAAWADLDAFEGPGYERVLVEVALEDGSTLEAWIYVGRESGG